MRCAAGKCARAPVFCRLYFSRRLYHKQIWYVSQSVRRLHADDTQLYVALLKKAINDAVTNLQNCLFDVHKRFSQNGLAINPQKSEAVLLLTIQQARAPSSPLTNVNVAGCIVPLTDTVKLLCVTIYRHLTFDSHVKNVCNTVYYHIRAFKHIRSSLSTDMAKTVASALVNSRLNYTNSVLYTQVQ